MAALRDRFVPAAVDQHVHRRLQDDEGRLFAGVLAQAGRDLGGRSQGVYIFDPAGRLLAFENSSEAARVRALIRQALAGFDDDSVILPALPPVPPSVEVDCPLPSGSVALQVTAKVLGGFPRDGLGGARDEIHAASLGEDVLWVRQDEVEALGGGTFPGSLVCRIARFHLVDNTRGEPPYWRSGEVRALEITFTDGTIEGIFHLETDDGTRGFTGELLGRVDATDGTLARFDLVARGVYWGEGTYTRGAPDGRFPFAVTVRIPTGCFERACRTVTPGGARGARGEYLQ